MVFDKNEVNRKIRAIALEVFPEFNPSYWSSHDYSNGDLLVVGILDPLYNSRYSFVINRDYGISYNGDILIDPDQRSNGYARRLVDACEKISLNLGAHLIIVNNNINSSFWEHLQYDPLPKSLERFLARNFRHVPCIKPLYKLLSEA